MFWNKENLRDPIFRSLMMGQCKLRSYQADAMRNIYDAVVNGKGGRFAVTFPRQSGKNEMQAQLEAAVMAANRHTGGSIIKIIPTEKNQGKVSTERLASVFRGQLSGGVSGQWLVAGGQRTGGSGQQPAELTSHFTLHTTY